LKSKRYGRGYDPDNTGGCIIPSNAFYKYRQSLNFIETIQPRSYIMQDKNTNRMFRNQAQGTLGREIATRGSQAGVNIIIDGQNYRIRAGVHTITGYSGHADHREIIQWVASLPEKPGKIKLVHGDQNARQSLGSLLRSKGYSVLE
jgi:predicted metal-dependent RNase